MYHLCVFLNVMPIPKTVAGYFYFQTPAPYGIPDNTHERPTI
jgi:hypothetical protein